MDYFPREPTKIAEWLSLVLDAQRNSGYHFDESLESYLVLTLDHYTKDNGLASSVLSLEFLEAVNVHGKLGLTRLRTVGDQCLLLSGLFPERALKKNVSLNYFIHIGKHAYYLIGNDFSKNELDQTLFFKLSENFVGLMDVLHNMRTTSIQKFSL